MRSEIAIGGLVDRACVRGVERKIDNERRTASSMRTHDRAHRGDAIVVASPERELDGVMLGPRGGRDKDNGGRAVRYGLQEPGAELASARPNPYRAVVSDGYDV